MQQSNGRYRVLVGMIAILALLGGTFWQPGGVAAQASGVFESAPYDQLAGIEYAVHRFYFTDTNIYLDAQLARFDTPANAALGLDALNASYLAAFTTVSPSMAFEPVDDPAIGTTSLAYTAGFSTSTAGEQTGEASLIQVHDDVFVYTVVGTNMYWDLTGDEVTFEAAIAMVEAMMAAPESMATPDPWDEGAPASAWAKFPVEGDAVLAPYGIYETRDTENFAVEPLPAYVVETYGNVEGLVSVVSREYAMPGTGDETALPVAVIEVAAFGDAANAEPAYAHVAGSVLEMFPTDEVELEETAIDVPADEAIAYAAEVEGPEGSGRLAIVVSRAGPYVILLVVATDTDGDAVALAGELVQAIIEAESGAGEGELNLNDGTFSGGLWEKLPAAGDPVLRGMEPQSDDQPYPDVEGDLDF
jgi:hypothetical protein